MSTQSSQGNLLFLADDLLRTLISFLGVDMASIRLCLETWHQAGKSILKENVFSRRVNCTSIAVKWAHGVLSSNAYLVNNNKEKRFFIRVYIFQ